MAPSVNPVTGRSNTTSNTIGLVFVGSAWVAPWLIVTVGGESSFAIVPVATPVVCIVSIEVFTALLR